MGDPNDIKSHGGFKPDWEGSDWRETSAFSNTSCPGSCHESPKPKTLTGKSTFFFADAADPSLAKPAFRGPGFYNPELLKWIQSQKTGSEAAPTSKASESTAPKPDEATVKKFTALALDGEKRAAQAGISDEEKVLHLTVAFSAYQRAGNGEKAGEVQKKIQFIYQVQGAAFEKLSEKAGLKTETQLDYLSRAISCYRAAKDSKKVIDLLQRMGGLYEKQGNVVGKALTDAEIAFLTWDPVTKPQGLNDAIALYEKLDKTLGGGVSLGLKEEQVAQIRGEVKSKLYAVYLKRGEWLASQQKYGESEKDLYEALLLQPSKPLLQIYLQVGYQAGLFNFSEQESKRFSLQTQEMRQSYPTRPEPCASHHKPPKDPWMGAWGGPIFPDNPNFDPKIADKISEHYGFMERGGRRFDAAIALVYAGASTPETRYEGELLKAEALERFGKRFEAEQLYSQISEERKDSKEPAEKVRRALAENKLAAFALQRKDLGGARTHTANALEATKDVGEAEKHFVAMQAKMIEAETYLSEGKVETARSILEEATKIPAGTPGSLQHQLAGKLKVRLAQVYYSKKETFGLGDSMAEIIKSTYPQDGELVGDAFFAKALSRVGSGRAREAIGILREEVQKPFPNSSVSKALSTDARFAKFLKEGTDGQGNKIYVLKDAAEINEGDWSEAFKVAIVRSGEGPLERKVAYGAAGGLGVAGALALAPEPVATKVAAGLIAIGVGVGLLWERFVTGTEHSDEIADAYRTGLSPVSNEQYFLGLAMLGADVAMLVGAGMVGQVVKGAVREGFAYGASRLASPLLRTGITLYGEDAALWAGRGLLYGAEASAGTFSTYGFYKLERTVFMGEKFQWNTTEALEWLAMGEFIGMAARTSFLGTAVAKSPLFQRGPLKNIVVDGEIVGKTTSEGLAAKWMVDATAGLSALYAIKQSFPSLKAEGAEKDPKFLEYLTQNLWMMGLIHVGGAAGRKLTGSSTEALVYRMDKRAQAYFAEAKEKFLADPPDWGSGWPRLQPAYAMAGAPNLQGFRFAPTFKPTIRPSIVVSLSSYRLGSESDLRVESAEKTHPKVESERVEQLRETIKSDLRQNSDWRRMTRGDFSFIDQWTPEQLLALEAVLKVDRPEVGEPAQLLKRMKETGFLDGQLLSLPPESLRGFASAANSRAKDGKGRSFVERVFFDYVEWKNPTGYFNRARESGVLFEKINDPATKTQRTRFDLLMEAYYWMQVGPVSGSRAVVDGTTGEYYDSHRVMKPTEPTGFGEKGWTSIESENQWRGNIDEAIRMGQMAKKNAWRPFHPEALQYVDMALGSVEYYAQGGGKAHDPLQPDGFRNDNWAEEYKSTYHQGVPADFAFSAMKNEVSFRNQVLKYGAAVKQGKLDGIIYRVTAKSIDPVVVDYIKKQIPNVRVIRYDSITDTQGKLVLVQMNKAPVERPELLKEARKQTDQRDYPFLIEDGKFMTYHLPPSVPDAAGKAFREQLALYTDTLTLAKTDYRDLGARLVDRAHRQTEWLGRIYDHLDASGRQALDAKLTALTTRLDAELPALRDEVSKAKRIAERIDALARETIQSNLLVWDEAPLGAIDGLTGKAPEGLGLLEDLPGQFKVYLTTPEARGPFQPSALNNKLRLPVGARIYKESLTLDQVELSFPASPSSSKGSKGKPVDTRRGSVLNFNAPNLEQNPSLEKKTDEAGLEYYEVKKEMVLEKGGYDISYLGDNPLFDFYQPAAAAQAKP